MMNHFQEGWGSMIPEVRKNHILEIIRKENSAKVSDLSARMGISEVTIRRDLRELDEMGLLHKTHGGAIIRTLTAVEPNRDQLEGLNVDKKKAIAKMAYQTLTDGSSIMMDSSSTCIQLAREICDGQKRNLTVVTNSFKAVEILCGCQHVEIIHIGGNVRRNLYSSIGAIAEASLRSVRVDKAFIGVNGVDFLVGLTTANMFESQIKRSMMAAANQCIVLADSTKFNRTFLCIFGSISEVDCIIADSDVPESIRAKALDMGIDLMIAP